MNKKENQNVLLTRNPKLFFLEDFLISYISL